MITAPLLLKRQPCIDNHIIIVIIEVPQTLFCRLMTILHCEHFGNLFDTINFPNQGFRGKMHAELLKKFLNTGNRFTTISSLQNNEERVLFQTGNKQLFPNNVRASL